jgi:hypothetical protein
MPVRLSNALLLFPLKVNGFELKLNRATKQEVRDRRKVSALKRKAALVVVFRP